MSRIHATLVSLALAAGCGSTTAPAADAGADAAIDAAIDAPPDAAAGPSRAAITAGGRIAGGSLVVDVAIAPPPAAAPLTGGTVVVTPAHPIAR